MVLHPLLDSQQLLSANAAMSLPPQRVGVVINSCLYRLFCSQTSVLESLEGASLGVVRLSSGGGRRCGVAKSHASLSAGLGERQKCSVNKEGLE